MLLPPPCWTPLLIGDDMDCGERRHTIPRYLMTAPWGGIMYEYADYGSLAFETKYVYLNGKVLAMIDKIGNKYFYHNDYLGTPKVMTDVSQRKVHEWLGYPFGKTYWISQGTDNTIGFTGKEFDKFNDLYYYGARYYFPDFGIFIEPEPFMGTNSLNLADPLSLAFYDYCRNNPLKYVDPDGRRAMFNTELQVFWQKISTAECRWFGGESGYMRSLSLPVKYEELPFNWWKEAPSSYKSMLIKQKIAEVIKSFLGVARNETLPLEDNTLVYADENQIITMYEKSIDDREIHRITIWQRPDPGKGEKGIVYYWGPEKRVSKYTYRPVVIRREFKSDEKFYEWEREMEAY